MVELILTHGVIHGSTMHNSGARRRVVTDELLEQPCELPAGARMEIPLRAARVDVLSAACRGTVPAGVWISNTPPLVESQQALTGWKHDVAAAPLQVARDGGVNGTLPEGSVPSLWIANDSAEPVTVTLLIGFVPAEAVSDAEAVPATPVRRKAA